MNAYGNTPLHLACYNGQDVVVSELIQAGAKVNQVCLCRWPVDMIPLCYLLLMVSFCDYDLFSFKGKRERFFSSAFRLFVPPGGAVPGAASDPRCTYQHAGVCVHARNLTVTPALNGCCQTLVEAESLEAVMETDFSPLTHKMHGHMEDDKGGWGGGSWREQAAQGMGNIHIISLELLWSDFFLLSCDLICEGVHTHKSDVILDQVSSNKLP